jgi:hypothetical protein
MKPIALPSVGISCMMVEIKYSTVQNWYPGNKEGKGFTICNQKRFVWKPMQKSLGHK